MMTPSNKYPLRLLTATAIASTSLACASKSNYQCPDNTPQQSHIYFQHKIILDYLRSLEPENTDKLLRQEYANAFAAGVLDIFNDRGIRCQGFLTAVDDSIQARTSKYCVENSNEVHIFFIQRANFDKGNYDTYSIDTNSKEWTCEQGNTCYISIGFNALEKLEEDGFGLKPSVYNPTLALESGALLITPSNITGEWTIHHVALTNGKGFFAYSNSQTQNSTVKAGLCQGNTGAPAFLGKEVCSQGKCEVELETYNGFPISVGHVIGAYEAYGEATGFQKWTLEDGRLCAAHIQFKR